VFGQRKSVVKQDRALQWGYRYSPPPTITQRRPPRQRPRSSDRLLVQGSDSVHASVVSRFQQMITERHSFFAVSTKSGISRATPFRRLPTPQSDRDPERALHSPNRTTRSASRSICRLARCLQKFPLVDYILRKSAMCLRIFLVKPWSYSAAIRNNGNFARNPVCEDSRSPRASRRPTARFPQIGQTHPGRHRHCGSEGDFSLSSGRVLF
jgi:hypothetical protein